MRANLWSGIVASDQIILVLRGGSEVVWCSELVGIFTESGALTSQKVIVVGSAVGFDDLSLAWRSMWLAGHKDHEGESAGFAPSLKSSKEGNRSAIFIKGDVKLN